jgi:MOSC domain-containing protein YiiM
LYRSEEAVTGRVVSLQVRTEKHGTPTPVVEVVGRVGGGLDGDIHAHRTSRAVLVVDRATLDALGLAPGDLREEITIEGLPDVTNLPVDGELLIGGATLRVNGPCEPCTHIGELLGVPDREEFRLSLLGRRGALCTVSAISGPIRVGDAVELLARRSSTKTSPSERCSATFSSDSLLHVSTRVTSSAAAASEDEA